MKIKSIFKKLFARKPKNETPRIIPISLRDAKPEHFRSTVTQKKDTHR